MAITKKKKESIRKLKYYFLKHQLHRFLPWRQLKFLGHIGEMSYWINNKTNPDYSTFPQKKFNYQKRFDLYEQVIKEELENEPIDYLEFGVSKGHSFRWWLKRIKDSNARFYGFDTFTGLPEDWGSYKAGDMSNDDQVPEIDDNRHKFYKGIFQDTLPGFLEQYEGERQKIIHLDADLYSSTLFVLSSMSPYLKKGDILLFDEFNVPMHEYKALRDWANAFYIDFTIIAEVNNYYQIAVRIK